MEKLQNPTSQTLNLPGSNLHPPFHKHWGTQPPPLALAGQSAIRSLPRPPRWDASPLYMWLSRTPTASHVIHGLWPKSLLQSLPCPLANQPRGTDGDTKWQAKIQITKWVWTVKISDSELSTFPFQKNKKLKVDQCRWATGLKITQHSSASQSTSRTFPTF